MSEARNAICVGGSRHPLRLVTVSGDGCIQATLLTTVAIRQLVSRVETLGRPRQKQGRISTPREHQSVITAKFRPPGVGLDPYCILSPSVFPMALRGYFTPNPLAVSLRCALKGCILHRVSYRYGIFANYAKILRPQLQFPDRRCVSYVIA